MSEISGTSRLVQLSGFSHAQGHSYAARLPKEIPDGDSNEAPFSSTLDLLEDGKGLGPAHTAHDAIGKNGRGSYSHWHDTLYFSTSDNSDPRINGRTYQVYVPPAGQGPKQRAMEVLNALPAPLTPQQAYAAVEQCLAILYPAAKIGEDYKSFWRDEPFVAAYRRLCGENYRALERKYVVHALVRSLDWATGDLVECGTYNGSTAYFMALANKEAGKTRPLHLFDSFEGLSPPLPIDGPYWQAGGLASPEELARENLSGFGNVHIRKGWIPSRFAEVADRQCSFVHIDVDLYQPTRDSVQFFYPRLQPGGMLVCDDFGFTTCPGARAAMQEYCADKPERIIELPTGQGLVIKR